MKYGIKTFGQVPNPNEVPEAWPALTVSYQDDDAKIEQQLISEGFTMQTATVYNAYVAAHQAEYDAWCAVYLIDELRQSIRDVIDLKTDELISNGFTYQEKDFKTDIEHQNSYMFDYLLNQNYPHTVKGKDADYITFQSREEHTLFIGYGFGNVNEIIRYGWELKDGLSELTYVQLLVWVDPRV